MSAHDCWFGPNHYNDVTDPNDRRGNKKLAFIGISQSDCIVVNTDMASPNSQHTTC